MYKKRLVAYVVLALCILPVLYVFYRIRHQIGSIIVPFLLAIPLVYIVKPLSERLQRKKISKVAAILSVYCLFILAFLALGIFFVPELVNSTRELLKTLPEMISGYQNMTDNFFKSLKSSKWPEDIKQLIIGEMNGGLKALEQYVTENLKGLLAMAVDAVKIFIDLTVAMVLAYYFVKDKDYFRDMALSLIPRKYRNSTVSLGKEVNIILAGFIQGQLLTALIVAVLESIGLMIAGVKYPLVLGLIGGIANVIPYFGPYIGALPAVAISLIDSPLKLFWTVIVFLTVQQLDNSYITPKIIEGRLGLHPVATIFAVLAGGELFGLVGMLAAVPVFAILRALLKKAVDAIAS